MKAVFTTLALITALTSTGALAGDVKQIEKTVDVGSAQVLKFEVPVGSLDIQTCHCSEVSIKVKVESSKGSWNIFSAGKDVDDAELTVRERGNTTTFKIDVDDTQQKWTVTLPQSTGLELEMGVGDIDIAAFNNDLIAEVGVGHIEVELDSEDFHTIKAETGVGNSKLRSFKGQVDKSRSIVSSSASYKGDGKYNATIEVGVGDISVSAP